METLATLQILLFSESSSKKKWLQSLAKNRQTVCQKFLKQYYALLTTISRPCNWFHVKVR